jgi:transposase
MPVVAERKRPEKELCWSVRRKTDAVVRLLRGEDIDTLARELRVEAHRLAAWRDEFVAAGSEGLKARPTEPADRKLREAERQVGRLTMELEVWRAAGRKRGLQIPPRKRPR